MNLHITSRRFRDNVTIIGKLEENLGMFTTMEVAEAVVVVILCALVVVMMEC